MTLEHEVLDRLTTLVQSGFASVQKRFDDVDRRLEGFEQRLEGFEQRLEGFEQRLEGFEQRLNTMDIRLSVLEERVHSFELSTLAGFRDVAAELNRIRLGVDLHFERYVDTRTQLADMAARLGAVEERLGMKPPRR